MLPLALIQGVTEFLPISSSAHLVLFPEVFGREIQSVGFDIILHAATLTAAVWYFRKDIRDITVGCLRGDAGSRLYMQALLLGTLPVVVAGPFLYNTVVSSRTAELIAILLIASGAALYLADWYVRRMPVHSNLPVPARALVIGMCQILSVFPGVSRSGITITAGRLLGLSRGESVRFSFLLSVPVIAGATVLAALSVPSAGTIALSVPLLISFAVAVLAAYTAIRLFIAWVERIGFAPFCIYQIALGAALLLLL